MNLNQRIILVDHADFATVILKYYQTAWSACGTNGALEIVISDDSKVRKTLAHLETIDIFVDPMSQIDVKGTAR